MLDIIINVYNKLYELYGPQGWWPIKNHKEQIQLKQALLMIITLEIMIYP